jgi:O-acetyl-ADP-ribose deacetylase (regulator of RNase III)
MKIIKDILIHNVMIKIIKGDITESNVDAIVNAANSHLQHGGGVAGAISRKGGPVIQEESNAIGYVPVGACAMTTGGRLKAPYVIHAVGPRMGEGNEENKLKKTINNVLELATSKRLTSIAIPAISAGIFGFPKDTCARILVEETMAFVKEKKTTLKEIIFCLIDTDIIMFFTAEIMQQERGGAINVRDIRDF